MHRKVPIALGAFAFSHLPVSFRLSEADLGASAWVVDRMGADAVVVYIFGCSGRAADLIDGIAFGV